MSKHYVHAYIGNGKGKSTAAAGLAVRAVGAGKKVLFVQLLKNGSSENAALKKLGVELITPCVKGFIWNMTDEQKKTVALEINSAIDEAVTAVCKSGYDLVVFDEILDAADSGMVEIYRLEEICRCPAEVVLTGRKLPSEIAPLCGYISEILPISHPYINDELQPRKGIEF